MAKLSVIITVYNMAPYIRDSIEAVLAQTYEALELIIIVDGGTDESWEICQSYLEKDNRIRVIHTENRGTAAARNRGIDASKGEYIGFLDGDDWIEPDFYETLIKLLETYDADVASCGFVKIEEREGLKIHSEKDLSKVNVYTSEEGIAMTFEPDKMRYSPCNKVYKRQLFDQIRYPEGVLYEDKGTTYKIFHQAKSIVYLDEPLYRYYIREDSVMRRPLCKDNFSLFKVNEELLAFLKQNYPKLMPLAEKSYLEECRKLLERIRELF